MALRKAPALIAAALLLAIATVPGTLRAARVKDIATLEGVRSNQLLGYGLVVGLEGTGDKQGTEFTIQSLSNMLMRMGIRVDPGQVKVKNVAAVMVTAELPAFARPGSRLDVLISSIGDAKSLQGGTLLLTPLRGVDDNLYALAQGPISIGGFSVAAGGDQVQKNFPTTGTLPGGAVVEKAAPLPADLQNRLDFVLSQSDFSTAQKMALAMNQRLGSPLAAARDSRTVVVEVPDEYRGQVVDLIARLETLDVPVDTPARIVMNERTGTIVMGENVRISTVALSHGGLNIMIHETPIVSQPGPFSNGKTVETKEREIRVEEKPSRLMVVPRGVSLGEVVRALNAVGVTPRDLIAILQVMKNAGAIHAELVIM